METNTIIWGDCLLELDNIPDNSIDSIVTDPPYGLSFMGKKWDYEVPSVEVWKECLRVLKPGGHLLSFAGSRTYHRIAINIEDAGFDIRDQIMWIYGSGFPKSLNIGKKLPEYEGWGTGLKPAHEPIVVARKPLSEKTVALNVLKWGTAGINIDACRIGIDFDNEKNLRDSQKHKQTASLTNNAYGDYKTRIHQDKGFHNSQGRFPANIILDEEAGKLLDEQSGELGLSKKGSNVGTQRSMFGLVNQDIGNMGFGDKGGASRFFYCAKASKSERNKGCEGMEAKYQANADFRPNHKEKALEGDSGKPHGRYTKVKNNHPTVKPIKLMRYLVRLVTPNGGLCLDPFIGSGTTAIACKLEGFDYLGIEKEHEYVKIAEERIKVYQLQEKL